MEGGFRGTPKGGVYTPPINLEVFFTHILATATRLNTSYGLETLHAQLSRHVGITQKVLRHIRHFWRIYDVINVGFFRHFAVFCYRKCHKVRRNSWFSHRICSLIGCNDLQRLKSLQHSVVVLLLYNRSKKGIFIYLAHLKWRISSSTCSITLESVPDALLYDGKYIC